MKNVLKPLAERVLISLGLTAAATYATILKKMFGSGTTASIIFMEEMNYVMKIVKSLEESDLLIKSFSETIKNHVKKQKGGFLRMLLGTLDASIPCQKIFQQVKAQLELVKARLELVSIYNAAHLLINFELQKYIQKELKFNSVY